MNDAAPEKKVPRLLMLPSLFSSSLSPFLHLALCSSLCILYPYSKSQDYRLLELVHSSRFIFSYEYLYAGAFLKEGFTFCSSTGYWIMSDYLYYVNNWKAIQEGQMGGSTLKRLCTELGFEQRSPSSCTYEPIATSLHLRCSE